MQHWSLWFCEYKYSSDYTKRLQASNLIGGWFQVESHPAPSPSSPATTKLSGSRVPRAPSPRMETAPDARRRRRGGSAWTRRGRARWPSGTCTSSGRSLTWSSPAAGSSAVTPRSLAPASAPANLAIRRPWAGASFCISKCDAQSPAPPRLSFPLVLSPFFFQHMYWYNQDA